MYILTHYIYYLFKYSSSFLLLGEESLVLPRQAVSISGGVCRYNRRSVVTWQTISLYYGLGLRCGRKHK